MFNRPFKFYLLCLLAFSIFLLSVSFLWKETFSIQQKVDDDKISNYATSIGSILTACSIYLLTKQLAEMEKDRSATSMPEIFPLDLNFETIDRVYPNPAQNTNDFLPDFYIGSKDDYVEPKVEFHNIGNGVAKNVSFLWVYDRDAVIAFIDGSYTPYHPEVETENTNFLPKERSFSVDIPYGYFMCYGESLQDSFEIDDSDNIKVIPAKSSNIPLLKLRIAYQDIHSKQYVKFFSCTIKYDFKKISIKFSENIQ